VQDLLVVYPIFIFVLERSICSEWIIISLLEILIIFIFYNFSLKLFNKVQETLIFVEESDFFLVEEVWEVVQRETDAESESSLFHKISPSSFIRILHLLLQKLIVILENLLC